jgi:hypothetical protein
MKAYTCDLFSADYTFSRDLEGFRKATVSLCQDSPCHGPDSIGQPPKKEGGIIGTEERISKSRRKETYKRK